MRCRRDEPLIICCCAYPSLMDVAGVVGVQFIAQGERIISLTPLLAGLPLPPPVLQAADPGKSHSTSWSTVHPTTLLSFTSPSPLQGTHLHISSIPRHPLPPHILQNPHEPLPHHPLDESVSCSLVLAHRPHHPAMWFEERTHCTNALIGVLSDDLGCDHCSNTPYLVADRTVHARLDA
ncbi:hypothetical protein DFH29DRAFT_967614 [Suillus ampliporus]|nr:hypothetical protein DFH29DRAFT_967614 [Suillus ampliporus]